MTDIFDANDLAAVGASNAAPAISQQPSGVFDQQMMHDVNNPDQALHAYQTAQQQIQQPESLLQKIGHIAQYAGAPATMGASLPAMQGIPGAMANWATGTVGTIASGWRGLIGIMSGENPQDAVKSMRNVQSALTYTPSNPNAQAIISAPDKALGAIQAALNKATNSEFGTDITHPGQAMGDLTYGITGSPLLASIATTLPTAAAAVYGRNIAGADVKPISPNIAQISSGVVSAGKATEASDLTGMGAATSTLSPNNMEGLNYSRGQYPMLKYTQIAGPVSDADQTTRANIVAQIMSNPARIRPGVVTGDMNDLRNEYELARAPNPTPAGALLKQHMADEQTGLNNYANNLLNSTGAHQSFINDYQRGNFLNDVLMGQDGLKGYIDSQKKNIYDQAMQTAGNQPVQMANLNALRANPQFSAELQLSGQKDFLGGMSNLIDMAQQQGFADAPAGSVAAMERLRQSLNRQWSPANKHFIGQAINAIDSDVASAGGPQLLQQARLIHSAEQTMFNSPGIKNLFGEVDPNGVQTATAYEKIPSKLTSMPDDQFNHIYNTFDSISKGFLPGSNLPVPEDLQIAAQQAKNEISGSLVRDVTEAGQKNLGAWNANAANKVMNSHANKFTTVLSPDQLQQMDILNKGGQLMPSTLSYEGAAQQLRRLGNTGLLENIAPTAGSMLGKFSAIPGANFVGGMIGKSIGESMKMNNLMQEARDLDLKMQDYAKLGRGEQ